MPKKMHHIRLSSEERNQLETIVRKGKNSALRQSHARILLHADVNAPDGGKSDSEVARCTGVSVRTVEEVRRICVEHGLDNALQRKKPDREYVRKLDGKAEAQLIAMNCGKAPEGHARWTLRLLASRLVELEIVDSISYEAVRQTLKKNELKPWLKKQWVIAPKSNAEFVAAIFCAVAPHLGWRKLQERERRTRCEYAQFLRSLADEHFPTAERIILVQDNLNTHNPASLYEAFAPAEAARIRARFEFHYTPKHGSWMNIAELELSALARGCLARRIPDRDTLSRELLAWETRRNQTSKHITWLFTSSDARLKLRKLYPSFHD